MLTYIIYAEMQNLSDIVKYYIANTNPIIWTLIPINSKRYSTSRNAEFEILRDYNNYNQVKQMIDCELITGVYIAEIDNDVETRRIRIL